MANKPLLGYWNIRGLGAPLRFLLAYLDVDYEEKRYDEQKREEWITDKGKLNAPFPNLPYWIEGTYTLTETRAIMKYLCRSRNKPELLGKTPEAQTDIDLVDSWIWDFCDKGLVTVCYQYTEELHKEYKQTEPIKLELLSKFLKDKDWVAGKDLSYIDFFVYDVLYIIRVYDDKCLDNFPKLLAYMSRFESLPAIKKHLESPQYVKGPVFSAMAKFKI